MLKTEMIDKLNEQMNLELYSSLLYQQMSAWCSYHSFEGAAALRHRKPRCGRAGGLAPQPV